LYDHVLQEGTTAVTEGIHSILDVFEVLLELSGIQVVNGQVALFVVGSIGQQGDGEQAAIGLVGALLFYRGAYVPGVQRSRHVPRG